MPFVPVRLIMLDREPAVVEQQRAVLRLLATGAKDDASAAELGWI
ncbi:hypothetical protein [Nonomuraea sp. NPDC052265]